MHFYSLVNKKSILDDLIQYSENCTDSTGRPTIHRNLSIEEITKVLKHCSLDHNLIDDFNELQSVIKCYKHITCNNQHDIVKKLNNLELSNEEHIKLNESIIENCTKIVEVFE